MARIDLKSLSSTHLKSLIENYTAHVAAERPEFRSFVEEHNRRFGGNFDLKRTVDFVLGRVRARQFTSYGGIAKLHGAEWSKVRHQMPVTSGRSCSGPDHIDYRCSAQLSSTKNMFSQERWSHRRLRASSQLLRHLATTVMIGAASCASSRGVLRRGEEPQTDECKNHWLD